jgi:hypothetical protein
MVWRLERELYFFVSLPSAPGRSSIEAEELFNVMARLFMRLVALILTSQTISGQGLDL